MILKLDYLGAGACNLDQANYSAEIGRLGLTVLVRILNQRQSRTKRLGLFAQDLANKEQETVQLSLLGKGLCHASTEALLTFLGRN